MHYTSQKDPILKKKRVRQVILTNALDRSYAFVAKRPNDSLAIPKGSNKLSAQKSKTKKLTADLEMQERIVSYLNLFRSLLCLSSWEKTYSKFSVFLSSILHFIIDI